MENTWRPGFTSQREEISDMTLKTEGSFPEWLDGTFISNGPGQFEVGDTELEHWFDALAMLRRFEITNGQVRYTNRFLRSEDYAAARDRQTVRQNQPGTPMDGSALKRLRGAFTDEFPDNASIGVTRLDETVYAVTESPTGLEVDPETLRTEGKRDLTAGLDSDITLGHTHVDDGVQWGLGASFGNECSYTLFRREAGRSPEPVSELLFDHHPPYIHSFALTERYAVIPESHVGTDFRQLLLKIPFGGSFLDATSCREPPAQFHVLDRSTGERVAVVEAEPFFVYHFANAYEDGNTVVVDCVAFSGIEAITGLTVENLRDDEPSLPSGDFVRYRLPLQGGDIARERLLSGPVEFPTINYQRVNGREYRYVYLAATDRGALPTAIAKVNLNGPTTHRWSEPGLHPGEAIFVPSPSAGAEDDGVLLSLALDGQAERSVLLCLDAATLTERARAPLPHRLPYSFHGQFYSRANPTRSMA
jgi:carotenoid cleavage dioxygenase-like enzyme